MKITCTVEFEFSQAGLAAYQENFKAEYGLDLSCIDTQTGITALMKVMAATGIDDHFRILDVDPQTPDGKRLPGTFGTLLGRGGYGYSG